MFNGCLWIQIHSPCCISSCRIALSSTVPSSNQMFCLRNHCQWIILTNEHPKSFSTLGNFLFPSNPPWVKKSLVLGNNSKTPQPFLTVHGTNLIRSAKLRLFSNLSDLLSCKLNWAFWKIWWDKSKAGKVHLKYAEHFHKTRVERHFYGANFTEDRSKIAMVKCILHIG